MRIETIVLIFISLLSVSVSAIDFFPINVSLSNYTVGAITNVTVSFQTTQDYNISQIWFHTPFYFNDISNVTIKNEYGFENPISITWNNYLIILTLNSTELINSSKVYSFELDNFNNPYVILFSRPFVLEFVNGSYRYIANGTSEPVSLMADSIQTIDVSINSSQPLLVGGLLELNAIGKDQFGNVNNTGGFNWNSENDSILHYMLGNGTLSAIFFALEPGNTVLTISSEITPSVSLNIPVVVNETNLEISNIQVNPEYTTAVISWNTNILADSTINYSDHAVYSSSEIVNFYTNWTNVQGTNNLFYEYWNGIGYTLMSYTSVHSFDGLPAWESWGGNLCHIGKTPQENNLTFHPGTSGDGPLPYPVISWSATKSGTFEVQGRASCGMNPNLPCNFGNGILIKVLKNNQLQSSNFLGGNQPYNETNIDTIIVGVNVGDMIRIMADANNDPNYDFGTFMNLRINKLGADYDTYIFNSNVSLTHSILLTGLLQNTTYHYSLISCSATQCNRSDDLTFTTRGVDTATLESRVNALEQRTLVLESENQQLTQQVSSLQSRTDLLETAMSSIQSSLSAVQFSLASLQFQVNNFVTSQSLINQHLDFLPFNARKSMVCGYIQANGLSNETAFGLTCGMNGDECNCPPLEMVPTVLPTVRPFGGSPLLTPLVKPSTLPLDAG